MTPEQIEEMRKDMEAGTPGPFEKCTDHEWYLDTPGENAYFVIGNDAAPFAVVAVEQAFGLEDRNEADMRRVSRIPDMEAEVLRLRETLERIETASRHFANPPEVMACESIRYAHETTARLAADALKGGA